MLGTLIGSALALGSSIYGGVKASQAMKDYKAGLEKQQKENKAWYDRRYNEDATQRADAQRMLTITQENIRNRNRGAAGAAAVMGSTNEAVAAEKAANNQALADTVSQVTALGDARKDAIEEAYMGRKDALNTQMGNLEAQRAANIASAVQGAASVGADIAGNDADGLKGLTKKKEGVK